MNINVSRLERLTRKARGLVTTALLDLVEESGSLSARKREKALRQANVVLNEMLAMILAAKKGSRA